MQKSIVVCSSIGLLLSSALIAAYTSADRAAATHITCGSGSDRFSAETPTGYKPNQQIAAEQIPSP